MSSAQLQKHTFVIPALDCPEEFALIDKGLAELEGIHTTSPDYLNRSLRIEFDPSALTVEAIAGRLRHIGFPSQPDGQPGSLEDRPELPVTPIRWTTVIAGALVAVAGTLHLAGAANLWLRSILIAATALAGWHVARAASRALRLRSIDMNVLMTIAAVGALATGDFFESATAMFLFSISLWLESYTLGRARRAVRSLVALRPSIAHRLCEHDHASPSMTNQSHHHPVTDIHPAEIRIGDLLLVKPGERVPVDALVTSGTSHGNEAPLTGESMPVEKNAGDRLFAGTLNGEGTLEVRATTTADESTLVHVARLVEQAQASRSPTERFVDRFARYYTPAVVAVALLIAFLPPFLAWAGVSWLAAVPPHEWLHRGLVLLVIACPCALVISTPVTILCGLQRAARLGLLVKGGEFLEWAGKLRSVAFDKTGTLTEGHPYFLDIRGFGGVDPLHVLTIAAALEATSEHPLATAIVAAARDRGQATQRAQLARTTRGAGVEGEVDGRTCFVGSVAHVLRRVERAELPAELADAPAGATVVLVGCDRQLLGAIYLADRTRADARTSIQELKQLGIGSIAMLTGDSRPTAARIAEELGIQEVHAELFPADKVRVVKQMVAEWDGVAMVGDGVNDAPALAAARMGIALGMNASDTALETADVVCLSHHLQRVPALIRLGRATRRILAQNIGFALAIKLGVLLLALLGYGTLWAAVAADVGASVLVVLNGMRLLR